jgi:NADH:ubiquinone reductase (H+-translocating)
VGHLIGMLGKESVYLEGVLARLMYRSLYKMHQQALHGTAKTALDMAAHRILTAHRAAHQTILKSAA